MTTFAACTLRNKPPLTGIETEINPLVTRRRFHGTLFVVVADRCPASDYGPDLRVRRFALEFDATKKRPRSVAAFRVDGARIERARIGASSASHVVQQPFWLLQGTRQRDDDVRWHIGKSRADISESTHPSRLLPTWPMILSNLGQPRFKSRIPQMRNFSSGKEGLEHDPEKHALGLDPRVGAGFPSGQTRSVCPEIMLKQKDRAG